MVETAKDEVVEEQQITGLDDNDEPVNPFPSSSELPSYAQPEPEAKAEDASPEKAEDKSRTAEWDKDRQMRDQELANQRKELQSLREDLAVSKSKMADFENQRDKKPSETEELSNKKLTAETEYEELTAHVEKMTKELVRLDRENSGLKQTLTTVTTSQQAKEDAAAELQMIDDLAKQYGAHFRNNAVQNAANFLAQCNRSKTNIPTRLETYLALKDAFRELTGKSALKTTTTRGNTIPLDTAKGGRSRSTAPKEYKSIDEAADDIFGKR